MYTIILKCVNPLSEDFISYSKNFNDGLTSNLSLYAILPGTKLNLQFNNMHFRFEEQVINLGEKFCSYYHFTEQNEIDSDYFLFDHQEDELTEIMTKNDWIVFSVG